MKTKRLDRGYDFERMFLKVFLEICEEKGEANYSEIARRAWPSDDDAVRRFRRIRSPLADEKPQSIMLRDAFNFALAIDRDLPGLVFLTYQRLQLEERKGSL